MKVHAHLRFLQIAPRKVRLVINLVRGMMVDRALEQLSILPKRSAEPITKLIKSAVANATHNYQLDAKTLKIETIIANEGPRLKRYTPKAYGRANPILKRMTHVTVILDGQELKGTKPAKPVKEAAPEKIDLTEVKRAPTARPKTPTKSPKHSKAEDKLKEHAGRDLHVPRIGTD